MMKKIIAVSLFLMIASCEKKIAEKKTSIHDSPAMSDPTKDSKKDSSKKEVKTWRSVKLADLNDSQKQQLSDAQKAQKELGPKLMGTVKSAMEKGGPIEAINACKGNASKLVQETESAHKLKIGRTSHKLRNPKNSGPQWINSINDGKHKNASIFEGPNGELGWAAPLSVGAMCVKCHGDTATMPDVLKTALTLAYPQDKATGFAQGDHRGWFWVEVPARK